MKIKYWIYLLLGLLVFGFIGFWGLKKVNFLSSYSIGQPMDSLNGVTVFYNHRVSNVTGRNMTADGYNLGLKYQCVEFVKRYYYEYLDHKMPDSYGHAKDFFDHGLIDGQKNSRRNLTHYTNPSLSKPKIGDLLIYDKTIFNPYGHIAIISNMIDNKLEIIQQNSGILGKSRETFSLHFKDGKWIIGNNKILGWLRKE